MHAGSIGVSEQIKLPLSKNKKKCRNWIDVVLEAVLHYIKYYDGSNEFLKTLHDIFAAGSDIESYLLPILDALFHAKGLSSSSATDDAAAANNGVEEEEAPAVTTEDYIQEHAGAILQALCHSQGLALESTPLQEAKKEFVQSLREKQLNPEFVMHALFRPKYDGEGLRKVVKGKLGSHRLKETVTKVVVPTFDIKRNQPVVFSTSKVP